MTPTEREDLEIAKEAYGIWRGSHNHSFMPSAWNDLHPGWRESYAFAVAHARHHEMALAKTNGDRNRG